MGQRGRDLALNWTIEPPDSARLGPSSPSGSAPGWALFLSLPSNVFCDGGSELQPLSMGLESCYPGAAAGGSSRPQGALRVLGVALAAPTRK